MRIDDRRPRARAHRAIHRLDDASFDSHAKVRARRLARGGRACERATNRLVIAEGLIRNRRCNRDPGDARVRSHRAEYDTRGADLHGIRRADGDRAERGKIKSRFVHNSLVKRG